MELAGVSLYDDNLNIKDTYVILNEVASKWAFYKDKNNDKLSAIHYDIAVNLVGIRGSNDFIMLMGNWYE